MLQHQKVLANLLGDLPTIKSDTNNIIEHTNEVEEFLSKKPRKWWILIKDNTFDIIENINEIEEFNYLSKLLWWKIKTEKGAAYFFTYIFKKMNKDKGESP